MTEEKKEKKESRPQSANNPLRRQKNNVAIKHGNPKKSYLSEKENEQLNKLTKKQKVLNQLNSPFKKEMKDILGDKTVTTKNLLSEMKETRTKRFLLPEIRSSGTALVNKRRTMKLGIIDANKGTNNENINDNNDILRKQLEINCGINRQNNTGLILLETQKEKGKLNTIRKNSFYKSKNNKSIDKINITINQKKKGKEIDDNKKIKKAEEIKNFNFNININNKKNVNINTNNNINTINKSINKEKNDLKKSKENNNNNINNNNVINNKKNNINNYINKRNNYIEVNTKNSNENKNVNINIKTSNENNNNNNNKIVKFNKEVSIINIFKDSNENFEIQKNSIIFDKEKEKEISNENTNTKEATNTNNLININESIKHNLNSISNINNINSINIENSSIEVKFISNININTSNQNGNDNSNDNNNNGNKYNNIVKSSANSNKNLSEISEQINTNLSTSKFEPFQEMILSNNNANKINCESSSDKNCNLIQSLSNNIETDLYLHKTVIYKNNKIFLGEIIYESPRSVIYKGLDLNTGEIICAKRYIDKNETEELKREIELFELINKEKEKDEINNIIKYYGFNCKDDANFIFLEYATGDNLKKIIKSYGGSLNEIIIRIYLKQILQALHFLHNKLKVAHRDIKCSNILLDKNGIIKLIDFGCSGNIKKQNEENEKNINNKNKDINKPFIGFKGSFPWCAPEVLSSQYYGIKCDIWSLGCAIIEMGGLEPWNNKINGIYEFIDIVGKSKEIPEIPKQFSNELKDFVLHCLEKDPDKRADTDFLLNHCFITQAKMDN